MVVFLPWVLMALVTVAAVYRPLITLAFSVVVAVALYAVANAAGPGALALLPLMFAACVGIFAGFVAFCARAVERRRNKK